MGGEMADEEGTRYLVSWHMDVWADSPLEASVKALEAIRREGSIANVFEVEEWRRPRMTVDLTEQKCGRCSAVIGYDADQDVWRDETGLMTCSPTEDDSPDHCPVELLSRWPS